MNNWKDKIQQMKNAESSARALMLQQNKTALQLLDQITSGVFKAGEWIDSDWLDSESRGLFDALKSITVKDGEFSELKNKVKCMNKVHNALNIAQPAFLALIEAGFKQKNDGRLYAKDKLRFDELRADLEKQLGVRIFISVNRCNYFELECYSHYKTSLPDYTGYIQHSRFKESVWLYDIAKKEANSRTYEMVSFEQLVNAEKRLVEIDKELSTLANEKSNLKRLLGV